MRIGGSYTPTPPATQRFRIGDVVTLKSGGPDMTIVGVNVLRGPAYAVTWFDGRKQGGTTFPEDALQPAPTKAQPTP